MWIWSSKDCVSNAEKRNVSQDLKQVQPFSVGRTLSEVPLHVDLAHAFDPLPRQ